MNVWSDTEWLTLQLGPVWVTSALLGRSHFDELEQEAFWQAVEDAPIGDSALPWQLMQAISRNRDWLLDEFILDDRSIITGLSQVTSLLERVPLKSAEKPAKRYFASAPGWRGPAVRSGGGSPIMTRRPLSSSPSCCSPRQRRPRTTR